MTAPPDRRRAVRLVWSGAGLRFEGGGTRPDTPAITIDGDNDAGPGPMLTLLLAAAGCTASDVLVILEKMRLVATDLAVDVEGVRRDGEPSRYDAIHLRYQVAGDALDADKVDRAVSLSLEKYCSVMHSLAPDIAVSYDVEVGPSVVPATKNPSPS